ncbi:MAG: hypothetical protein V4719_09605 [Planctomycetota bacterium]
MLPTCPACKQSVLDDDATECPFCGANMKTGKGGSAKPPAATKPAAPAAKSPATPPPATKSTPSKPTSKPASRKSMLDDDDDDPFAAGEDDDPFAAATKQDAANKAKAIPVSVKKTKTHVVELKCPMCDTVGFVPENVGGKDVKCSNPKCTVPVFMAPKIFGAPAPIAPPPAKPKSTGPSKKPLIFAIVGGVAFVAIVGLAVLFWPDTSGPPAAETDFKALAEKARQERAAQGLPDPVDVAANTGKPNKPGDPAAVEAAAPAAPALDVAHTLILIEDYGQQEQLVNKKYCRVRTAIGYATINDVPKMQDQFHKLDQVETSLQHFKIPALLTLGWQQLAAGKKAEAAKTADEALAATVKIGKGSRDTQESVMDLAAFLVANNKADAARKLMDEHFNQDSSTSLVVTTAFTRHQRLFDFDLKLPGSSANPNCAWGEVGVTLILTSEGLWNEAQQWAESNPDVEARTDCVVAWADARLQDAISKKQPVDANVEGVGAKLTPAGKVQLLAQLGLTQAVSGNNAEAERLMAAAAAALKAIPVPPPARFPTANEIYKEILAWKSPELVPLRQAIVGATLLGQVQARLKKSDEAWNSMLEALTFARGMAPSPAAARAMNATAQSLPLDTLRDKVRTELNLRSRDEATRKARELLNKFDSIVEQGIARYRLQEAILKQAVEAGLTVQVWREALSLSQRNDPNELEPYLSGTLPLHLIQSFNAQGLTKEAGEVTTRIEGTMLPTDEVMDLKQQIAESLKNQKISEIVGVFSQRRLTGAAEEFALKTLSQLAKQPGQALPTLAAVTSMDVRTYNQFVKLEALRMLAAYAGLHGSPAAVGTAIQNQKQLPLERVSAYLGLLEGFTAWKKAQPPSKAEADKTATAKTTK